MLEGVMAHLLFLQCSKKSHKKIKIGMTGFEPATSCSQSRRATKLRYIPLHLVLIDYTPPSSPQLAFLKIGPQAPTNNGNWDTKTSP
jgi:hypothetical protein